jgi:hypothetical protein
MPHSGPEEPGAQHLNHQSLTIGRSTLGGVRFRYCAHFYRQTDTSHVVHSHQGMPSVDQRPLSQGSLTATANLTRVDNLTALQNRDYAF